MFYRLRDNMKGVGLVCQTGVEEGRDELLVEVLAYVSRNWNSPIYLMPLSSVYCNKFRIGCSEDLVEVELNYYLGLGIFPEKSRGNPFQVLGERATFAS